METQGIIRKISIGDIKEGITYKVGQSMLGGRLTIEEIVHDTEALLDYSINKYHVFVSEQGSVNVRLWKSFMDVPISVEYDISLQGNEDA